MTIRAKYLSKKLKELQDFGYPDLTHQEVEQQLDAALSGAKVGKGLNVIGAIIEKDFGDDPRVRQALAASPAPEGP